MLAGHVERGDLPGLVMLVSHRGEVHAEAIGRLAFEGSSMSRDSLFRITSMTKPVTAAAAMVLVEEGRLQLDDPVDRWLPELAGRKVLLRYDVPVHQVVPARRAITLRDLLTFRCGYGIIPVFPEHLPIQRAYAEAGLAPGPVFPSFPPDELMRRYGSLPLIFQPGERWLYNAGSEILGVLIARVAGKTFGEFLHERIFAPLGMKDTAFYCAQGQALSVHDRLYVRFLGAAIEGVRSSGDRPIFKSARRSKTAPPVLSPPRTISTPSRR